MKAILLDIEGTIGDIKFVRETLFPYSRSRVAQYLHDNWQTREIQEIVASSRNETGKSLKWKERKKLLKEQISAIKKDNDMSKGAKVALIILSVAIALGLLYAVAALACNISCGGSEAGAIVVMVGGAAVVTFLLIIAIKSITGKKKKPKKTDINPDDPAKTGS